MKERTKHVLIGFAAVLAVTVTVWAIARLFESADEEPPAKPERKQQPPRLKVVAGGPDPIVDPGMVSFARHAEGTREDEPPPAPAPPAPPVVPEPAGGGGGEARP